MAKDIVSRDSLVEPSQVQLLRVHVISARGLPRSNNTVGMPDPFVVVYFNGEKVGQTEVDRQTRQPDWHSHVDIRSDLGFYPEGALDQGVGWDGCLDDGDKEAEPAVSFLKAASAEGGRTGSAGRKTGGDNELLLEVWDYESPIDERARGSKPGEDQDPNFFDDRLFDLSFISKTFRRGAMRGVSSSRSRALGVCRIGARRLRLLGASAEPMDLPLWDPKGSWWGRGTIRISVSLERLSVQVIEVHLRDPMSVLRGTLEQGQGEEDPGAATGPLGTPAPRWADVGGVQLLCKVTWKKRSLARESQWDRGFCLTSSNNTLVLDSDSDGGGDGYSGPNRDKDRDRGSAGGPGSCPVDEAEAVGDGTGGTMASELGAGGVAGGDMGSGIGSDPQQG
ncbi:unnamed protein product, partial [Discosporangium mesarthrocarpum]